MGLVVYAIVEAPVEGSTRYRAIPAPEAWRADHHDPTHFCLGKDYSFTFASVQLAEPGIAPPPGWSGPPRTWPLAETLSLEAVKAEHVDAYDTKWWLSLTGLELTIADLSMRNECVSYALAALLETAKLVGHRARILCFNI